MGRPAALTSFWASYITEIKAGGPSIALNGHSRSTLGVVNSVMTADGKQPAQDFDRKKVKEDVNTYCTATLKWP
ncbi:hypothetical protein P175DRAFT_0555256, partial [Aspergillus ochraceoroseus IBT 24754]